MTNILDLVNLWDTPYKDYDLKQICTVYEVEQNNKNKMRTALLNAGYQFIEEIEPCIDGETYKIIEIRGPKASGFFYFF